MTQPHSPNLPSMDDQGDGQQMADRASEMKDNAADRANEMKDTAAQQAGQMKDSTIEQAERGREKAAEGTQNAASKIREQSEGRGGMQEKVGTTVADTMERTAGYLRENRTDQIWDDLEQMARERPMQALGGAVIAGFLLGRILR